MIPEQTRNGSNESRGGEQEACVQRHAFSRLAFAILRPRHQKAGSERKKKIRQSSNMAALEPDSRRRSKNAP